ncbi:MAG: MoaD/ThiS family protein [Sphingomonas sp.]
MRILLYGRLADAIEREVELDALPGASVGEIRRHLAGHFPAASVALGRSRACVSNALVGDEHILASSDKLEFLPPVSGG